MPSRIDGSVIISVLVVIFFGIAMTIWLWRPPQAES